MLTCAQITIRDDNDMTIAAVPPANPAVDTLWLDTSVTPNMLKRWNGTAWVECGAQPVGNEIIVGTQTAATAAWTGVASFAQLADGQQITYWLPYSSTGSVTLALTLSGGTVTEAIPCYYSSTARLTTHYSMGNVIHFTYLENAKIGATTIAKGWWADANYNVDTYDRVRFGSSVKAKTAIGAGRLIVGDEDGYFNLAASVPFDVTKPILWAVSALAINVYGNNNYLAYPYSMMTTTMTSFSGTINKTCYLVGTLNGSIFTPIAQFLTSTIPTTEDGYTYLALGPLISSTQIYLYPEHPMYRFVDGAFKSLGQVAYEAHEEAETVRTDLSTAIEQTDAAIALKADKTVTDSLGNRLDTAEASITTQAGQISSVVSQSQTTTNNLAALTIGGRNYVRNSNNTVELNNSGDSFTSAWMNPAPIMSDDFLTDCKGKTICISYYAMCENLERATSGSWIGIQITYNTETANSYVYNTMTVTTVLNSGTKAEDRYRLYTTIPTAAVSVRSTMVTIQNCKGIVRIRNPQVECGNRISAYRPAPEDLEYRMDSAESSITQHANQIAFKVNTATYNAEKVYRGTAAPASPSADTLWLDTSLSPNILKRWTGSAWVAMGAQELKTSGITIGPNNVSITTEQFLLQLLDPNNNENVLMEMSASGNVGFKELYADEIISDSVPLKYHGPTALFVSPTYSGTSDTYFRSLGEAVTAVNNRYLPYDLYIYLPYNYGTVYEYAGIQLRGVSGPGKLVIYGYNNTTLASYITIKGCSAHIMLQYVSLREIRPLVNGTNRNGYLIECQMNHFVELNGCTLDANGTTYDSVYVRSSHVVLISCGLYNALQGLEVYQGTGVVKNCVGSCSWAMVAYAGIIFAYGTVPAGSRSSGENGQVFATGVTVNYGTAIPTVTPDETTIQYATLTKSWRGSWRSDTVDVIQGVYSDSGYSSSLNWNRGCMWFGNLLSLLSGTTISSATLTLHRKTGSGSGAAKTVYLCAITNTSASGTPSIAVNYGALGTIGRGATVTFGIPVAAVQGLANGTYGGLCLYETPYNFGSSTYSNCYMRMSGTDESSYKPYLTIVYSGGTSWG